MDMKQTYRALIDRHSGEGQVHTCLAARQAERLAIVQHPDKALHISAAQQPALGLPLPELQHNVSHIGRPIVRVVPQHLQDGQDGGVMRTVQPQLRTCLPLVSGLHSARQLHINALARH